MDNEERDELDAIGDPDLLKLLLRRERTDAAAKEAALQEELETLRAAMRPRLERPDVISLADLQALSLDERVATWEKIRRNQVRLDLKGPRTPPPITFMTRAQVDALPLDERVATQRKILAGTIKLL